MARLIDRSSQAVQEDRLDAARTCHKRYKNKGKELIIALKGAGTLIVTDNENVMVNTSGNPWMATGGMGDVLAGVIGSLLCQGLSAEIACGAGVYLHGMAGDILFNKIGPGFTASELSEKLPVSIKTLQEKNAIDRPVNQHY